jgi:hypothetical protein
MKWLLPLLLLPLNVFAVDEIRLDRAPYAGADMKIEYQADTELCYAYSAVYLIDFERNDKSSPSSPLFLGIDYKNKLHQELGFKRENETPNLGKTCDAISKVKRVFKKLDDNNIVEEKKFKVFMESLNGAYLKFDSRNIGTPKAEEVDCLAINKLNDLLGVNKSVASIEKALNAPAFINFLALTLLEDEKSSKVDYQCQEVSLVDSSLDAVHAKLEAGLDHKKPVAITYCSGVLLKGNKFQGVKKVSKGFFGSHFTYELDAQCGQHASVVVGKRIKNGVVQYLVQDSMGNDFTYHSDLEKENGRLWIDQKVLLKNLTAATYIH